MVNVRQISFNNEIYVTVWVTPRSFKNFEDFYKVFIRMRMKESSTLSSQSTSDCHKKGLRWNRKFGNIFLKRNLHFVIYGCVLKLKVILFHGKFSFYLIWVSNVNHYLLLNTSVWFIMGDTVVCISPAFTESAQFPLVVLDIYYCHAFASQERQVMFFGVVSAWVKAHRFEQPPSVPGADGQRCHRWPCRVPGPWGELHNGKHFTWQNQS